MTTTLTKPVRRRTNDSITIRDRSKWRPVVITLYPAGYMGLRLAGTRREETIAIEAIYERAVIGRVQRERVEKINAKKRGCKIKRARF
jgi:hypothetical protein